MPYSIMQKFPLGATLFLTAIPALNAAAGQTSAKPETTCAHVRLLSNYPLSRIPAATQTILRRAVRPELEAIIHNPGMGMSNIAPDKLSLNALEIARPAKHHALYIVAWDDDSFGVNGFNWIVEAKPGGSVVLMSDHASSVANGFGVTVLGSGTDPYPEIMIASKGFAEGGGAEAEAGCFQKAGPMYENTSCPASCQDELNSE